MDKTHDDLNKLRQLSIKIAGDIQGGQSVQRKLSMDGHRKSIDTKELSLIK